MQESRAAITGENVLPPAAGTATGGGACMAGNCICGILTSSWGADIEGAENCGARTVGGVMPAAEIPGPDIEGADTCGALNTGGLTFAPGRSGIQPPPPAAGGGACGCGAATAGNGTLPTPWPPP